MLVWMAPLAMLTIGMMVALRVTRNMIAWMRPVATLIFGTMLTDHGRGGVLIVAELVPVTSQRLQIIIFITSKALERKSESLPGDVPAIRQAIIASGQEEAESSWKALFKTSEGFPEPSQGPPEGTRRG